MEELGTNLKDLEAIVQGKSNNLRVVEDGTRHFFRGLRRNRLTILLSVATKSS